MRKFLDALYNGAAAVAAFCMVMLLVQVMLSISGRLLHFHVKGTDAYAGYMMAAAGFLALAHTLKRGEHIRVTLLLSKVSNSVKHWLECWALLVTSLLAGLMAFYSCRLVYQSIQFNDISTSNDATPLWIPQLAMAVGTVILLIAFLDEFFLEVTNQRKEIVPTESLRNE